jgi:hypothetical protein
LASANLKKLLAAAGGESVELASRTVWLGLDWSGESRESSALKMMDKVALSVSSVRHAGARRGSS